MKKEEQKGLMWQWQTCGVIFLVWPGLQAR
jgi:hypothetical protein